MLSSTCLVGHPSIEATTTPATGTTRPSRKPTPQETPSHRAPLDTNTLTPTTSVQATPPLLLRTGHSMAKLTPIDTECHHGPHTLAENTSHVKCFSSTDHIFMTPTAIHVKPSTGRPMRSPGNHVVASNHGSISCTSNSVCIHCFCNIPNY